MKSLEFESWDAGRLTVNRAFAGLLRSHGLTTFRSLMDYDGGTVAKRLLRERTTTRITLAADGGEQAFYLKRHGPSPWKEYVKPLLRLTWPILGARNEWEAMIGFHRTGIPTMVPVALGESGRQSFVLTQAIDGCQKASHWMEGHLHEPGASARRTAATLVDEIAGIARRMHAAGMHHQDFYLTHFLVANELLDETAGEKRVETGGRGRVFLIDLGRVRRRRRLSQRWIVKDLAQLDYSARLFSDDDRRRFLERYLGRPLEPADGSLLRRVRRKSAAIARHSRKNRL